MCIIAGRVAGETVQVNLCRMWLQQNRLRHAVGCSPARQATIEAVSAKLPNAITPPPVIQALAMALCGINVCSGLTPAQALQPSTAGGSG